ncbi:SPARC-related modular calcium-binding protein 1 isoform X1 [Bactrocera neohumeralis]|uniref:SPARC-related modular calcium-binding protein 1 isoform X1 n=1 Tax=Bactrocera neohumeralis TaxID=98809 RepID=UPI00216669EF|nr:SPARC-related modular calcium-binding protein 1 isoform X1 [Bactrocera neohumeralis]
MYISSFIVMWLCAAAAAAQLGLAANVPARRERHELTISECAARGGECDETKGRPVCGTDDQTYPSRCHLLRAQCSGYQVSLKYRGHCKAACKEAREYALKHRSSGPPKFIPRCKSDGTYAAVQCLGDMGCWCSDIAGKPIENTSVRNGKPKCREYTKANIRRSPSRHVSPSRLRRTCTAVDRAAFNANLIKVFQSEYVRAGQLKRGLSGKTAEGGEGASNDKLVLDWKFTYLDVNANQMLDKNEFRELKKLVKRAVKPRRCGRAFGKFCDLDDDDRLTLTEWNDCFSKDEINRHSAAENKNYAVNSISSNSYQGYTPQQQLPQNNNNGNNRHAVPPYNHHTSQMHLNNHQQQQQNHNTYSNNNNNNNFNLNRNDNLNNINHSSSTFDDLESESTGDEDESGGLHGDYEDEDYEQEDGGENSDTLRMLNSTRIHWPKILEDSNTKLDTQLNESESESECLADQKATLEEQRHGGTLFYVPECTSDGRYQRVQCYRSTPYCWCVNEDTGKNIPGTTVKDKRPQCDVTYAAPRPMKGCPEPRKAVFLNDLKEFLKTHIVSTASAGGNATKWGSEDERIATLSFVLLDKNKNKVWERKEWKTFREMVTSSKTLRKCGKKMPRYCDVNGDKKITLTEWLNCLQTQRNEVQTTSQSSTEANISITSKPLKLTGSNPLEQYLKD